MLLKTLLPLGNDDSLAAYLDVSWQHDILLAERNQNLRRLLWTDSGRLKDPLLIMLTFFSWKPLAKKKLIFFELLHEPGECVCVSGHTKCMDVFCSRLSFSRKLHMQVALTTSHLPSCSQDIFKKK